MPRPPLSAYEAGVFHVTAKAVHRDWLFAAVDHRTAYLALLTEVAQEHGWRVIHFCLMGNHVHLLLWTEVVPLSAGVRDLHSRFAGVRNAGERTGACFHRRFFRKPVLSDAHLAAAMAYIARNPVAAGLARDPSGYAWSAHRALVGLTAPPPFLDVDLALAPYDDGATGYAATVASPDDEDLDAVDRGRIPLGPDLRLRLRVGDPTAFVEAHRDRGWSFTDLAALLDLHRQTVARRIANARALGA